MITIISGTNRPGSNTLKVAKYYQDVLAKKGETANVLSMSALPDNMIASDLYGKRSAEFEKIQELVVATTKFIFIIPEYNGSFPGVLKTFIDACSFPDSFYDKKACLVGISSGKYGNIRGIDHFGGVCSYLHLNVLPLRLHIPAIKTELDENDAFFKEDTLKYTNDQIEKFIAY
jgi:chromate reductase